MGLTIEKHAPPLRIDADGVVRVGQSRVTLDTVVYAYRNGATVEEIAQGYPALDLPDIYAVVAYYLRHRDEVDEYLAQREQEAEILKEEVQKLFPTTGLRKRLLARQARKKR